jgi:hypothetical protein
MDDNAVDEALSLTELGLSCHDSTGVSQGCPPGYKEIVDQTLTIIQPSHMLVDYAILYLADRLYQMVYLGCTHIPVTEPV